MHNKKLKINKKEICGNIVIYASQVKKIKKKPSLKHIYIYQYCMQFSNKINSYIYIFITNCVLSMNFERKKEGRGEN